MDASSHPMPQLHDRTAPPWAWLALGLLLVLLIGVRIAAPSDIDDHAQTGPLDHALDVAYHGSYLMQHDAAGRIASKPPAYPWLAAAVVRATGTTSEWTFKLPLLAAFLGIAWLTYDLARRSFGEMAALLAVAFWAASAHTFKLMYTARTDMLVACWIVLGLWCVQRLRERWADGERRVTWREAGLGVTLWGSVAAALLTKGPPAALIVLWLVVAVAWDGAWKRCRPHWHLAGFALAVAALMAWLLPTIAEYPGYLDRLRFETVERITGAGTGARRTTSRLAVIGYFLGRFAPWSIAFVAAVVLLRAKRELRWVAAWVVLVLVFFALSKGIRADYLVPAYPPAAIAAAALIDEATRRRGRARLFAHLLLGGLALVGLVLPLSLLGLHAPPALTLTAGDATVTVGAHYGALLVTMVVLGAAAGAGAMWWTHRRRYDAAALAGTFVIAAVLTLYQASLSDAATARRGDTVHAVARLARALADDTGRPLVIDSIDDVPVAVLLAARAALDAADDDITDGAILVTSLPNWTHWADTLGDRAAVLLSLETHTRHGQRAADLLIIGVAPPGDVLR